MNRKICLFLFILLNLFYFKNESWAQNAVSNEPRIQSEDESPGSLPEPETPKSPQSSDELSSQKELQSSSQYTIFDDNMLLDGYTKKYVDEPKEILIEMIKDDTLTSYKTAAAVRVLRSRFSAEIFSPEKKQVEKYLIHRLNRTDSTFVQVEIMHTLCLMDRYKYFSSMVPILIQKLDHYNTTVNEMAYAALLHILDLGHNRPREAQIVFTTLRKVLFLSRKRLTSTHDPSPKLKQKLQLLRWSIKVLGSQELKRLPREVINLL